MEAVKARSGSFSIQTEPLYIRDGLWPLWTRLSAHRIFCEESVVLIRKVGDYEPITGARSRHLCGSFGTYR